MSNVLKHFIFFYRDYITSYEKFPWWRLSVGPRRSRRRKINAPRDAAICPIFFYIRVLDDDRCCSKNTHGSSIHKDLDISKLGAMQPWDLVPAGFPLANLLTLVALRLWTFWCKASVNFRLFHWRSLGTALCPELVLGSNDSDSAESKCSPFL